MGFYGDLHLSAAPGLIEAMRLGTSRVSMGAVAGLALAALGGAPAGPLPATADRPTVVLIAVSGLGTRLGCYGAPVETPNIDRLSRMGRRFERAYTQYPAGPPSFVSLMTGWRPDKTGVWGPPRAPVEGAESLQNDFRSGGYQAARVGPIYGGAAEAAYRWAGPSEGAADPAAAAKRATELLEVHRDDRLFLAVGLDASKAPAEAVARYPKGALSLPADGEWSDIPAISISPARVDRPGRLARPTPLPPEARRGLLADRNARAAYVDAQVGTILGTLDRLKMWDRVAVVFVSDHGTYLGERGEVLRKDLLYEETLRTSLIVTTPGMNKPGEATSALTELVDVYPTLVELCGLRKPGGLQGSSFMPALLTPGVPGKPGAYSVAARDAGFLGRSVRTDRYRYTEWPDGSEELYDHDADPHEWTNLAASPGGRNAIPGLRKLLDERETSGVPPAALPAPARRPGAHRPNVLLVIFDDMTVQLGCYGYPVKSPNIDRLAGRGRRFDRAYCQVAMCSPSRMSLMAGWRPERVDVWNNAQDPWRNVRGAVPLQEHFHANGYFTARVGKIYHGKWNQSSNWDESVTDIGPLPPPPAEADSGATARFEADGAEGTSEVSHFWLKTDNADVDEPDGRRAREAVRILDEHQGRPFFLALGFGKPHLRWVAPRRYFDLYSPEDVAIAETPDGDAQDIPEIAIANARVARPRQMLPGKVGDFDAADRRRALAAQYACVSFADAQLGVVLGELDRLKLADNTIVVVLGDHGFQLGEHGLWRKDTLFEESARAPLVIAGPGVNRRGTATRALVEFDDVYPTLVDLAELPRPAGLQGTSLVPLLKDPEADGRAGAFTFRACGTPQLGRSVRNDRYRFTEWPDGSRELYDLTADPGERRNLAADAGQAGELGVMLKLLYR
jgi:iduronate 2-sulfatase